VVSAVTLITAFKVPAIPKFRWDENNRKEASGLEAIEPAREAG